MAAEDSPLRHREALLQRADIREWIKDHRNPHTAQLQFDQLELFCRRTGKDPNDLLRLASEKPNNPFRAFVVEWAEAQRAAGRPDQYLKSNWFAVKSWLKHNEVSFEWSPPFNVQPAATLENERIPTSEELRRLISVLSARDRAAVLFLASSGARIGVLASRYAADGLTLGNFPDIVWTKKGPKFRTTPAAVHVPTNLAKGVKEYYTFISGEAADAISAYLSERQRRGEKLGPESPVITIEPKTSTSHFRRSREGSLFISGKSLGQVIRVGLRKVMPKGVRVRPHTLRGWTSSNLERAEREGLITRTVREYFLGHDLKGIDKRYNVGKKLSPEAIEELREVYKRCEPFLETAKEATAMLSEVDALRETVRIMGLVMQGKTVTEEELTKAGLSPSSAKKVGQSIPGSGEAKIGDRKILPVADVSEEWFVKGWAPLMPLGSDRMILKFEGGGTS